MSSLTSWMIWRPTVSAIWLRRESAAGIAPGAGKCHAERFGHACHRGRRSHHLAVARASTQATLHLGDLFVAEASDLHLVVDAPAVRYPDLLAVPVAVEHRATRQHQSRDVRAGGAHQGRPARSCRSRRASRHRRAGNRECSLQRPSPSGCGRASRWVSSAFRPARSSGTPMGKPPACHTPRLTASATIRRWALQLLSSLQLLAMPITGRP